MSTNAFYGKKYTVGKNANDEIFDVIISKDTNTMSYLLFYSKSCIFAISHCERHLQGQKSTNGSENANISPEYHTAIATASKVQIKSSSLSSSAGQKWLKTKVCKSY